MISIWFKGMTEKNNHSGMKEMEELKPTGVPARGSISVHLNMNRYL